VTRKNPRPHRASPSPVGLSILALLLLGGPLPGRPSPSSRERWTAREVNLLSLMGLRWNGAGPLLVRTDPPRNRVILVQTLTSSVTLVEGDLEQVRNVPTGSRVPQYLKEEALALNERTGEIYLVGDHCILLVRPDGEETLTMATPCQFEAVAVDPATGRAFLAGRESSFLGMADPSTRKLTLLPWAKKTGPLENLNQTPPPPIRKLVWDSRRNRLLAVDGMEALLWSLDGKTLRWSRPRPLPLRTGGRWHLAGFDQESGRLYLVVETAKRKAVQAAALDTLGRDDQVLPLPGLTEPAGITLDARKAAIYIPYDNHPLVQTVDFLKGRVGEIALPAYGNDASALDRDAGLLYVASWAHGEIDVVDLRAGRLRKRIRNLGILPHMFSLAWNPKSRKLYIPIGATAVNGSFGSALTVLDPATGRHHKVRTGWAPVDLVPLPGRKGALVFGNEDRAALVSPGGRVKILPLPPGRLFPLCALALPGGGVYLSYGPHQSYWPNVYIWGARDGILEIRGRDLSFYDRRIPRQAQGMALDENGALYLLQNNWGREEAFLSVLPDRIRLWEARRRILLGDKVQRETTQAVLRYDRLAKALYALRIGEKDSEPGILLQVDLGTRKVTRRVKTGRTPVDLAFDREKIYVACFDSAALTVIGKKTGKARRIPVPEEPLRVLSSPEGAWILSHRGRALSLLERTSGEVRNYPLPGEALPDALALVGGRPWVVLHGPDRFQLLEFHPARKRFQEIYSFPYPFGDTAFDKGNASFFVRGRFGDGILSISRIRPEGENQVWVSDFLSGRVLIFRKIRPRLRRRRT